MYVKCRIEVLAFDRMYCSFSLAHHIGIGLGSNTYGSDPRQIKIDY